MDSHDGPSVFGCIFNSGVPTLVSPDTSTVLRGISDEALEECFPPSPEEAAELEAVEQHIHVLASLSLLEDREEENRESFAHYRKRWEARRELQGRPRSVPLDNTAWKGVHGRQRFVAGVGGVQAASMVPYPSSPTTGKTSRLMNGADATQGWTTKRGQYPGKKSKPALKGIRGRHPIQQPRKLN